MGCSPTIGKVGGGLDVGWGRDGHSSTASSRRWRRAKSYECDLQLVPLDGAVQDRTQALMAKYRDMPMDLANATLVAAAEALGLTRVFTLDRDFQVYRWRGKRKFAVIP